ncbi:hypothetical protein RB3835 [Rhodopirellula baltica SH 1]|uniref:Uncharacterized protein n=1 Tax=Rhodopirellula baltica (strain DSM 10527 / NCIMB 13988 / SH1) TaxID=243090 RepID=Q7UTK1_RHOBA|nr:hypothetical protein RB3835 [Rhodopirellula baltica SH 1]
MHSPRIWTSLNSTPKRNLTQSRLKNHLELSRLLNAAYLRSSHETDPVLSH